MEKLSWHTAARRCNERLEFFSLASTPNDEECTQAGEDTSDQKKEVTALINQLIRVHGDPPEGAEFFILKNEHEFGVYYEAGIFFTMLTEEEMEEADRDETDAQLYAHKIETGIPDKWDKMAIQELKEMEHSRFVPKQPAMLVKHRGKVVNIKTQSA